MRACNLYICSLAGVNYPASDAAWGMELFTSLLMENALWEYVHAAHRRLVRACCKNVEITQKEDSIEQLAMRQNCKKNK
jgi:hypothetical protein